MTVQTLKSTEEIQAWLTQWIAKELELKTTSFSVDDPFTNIGLSSRQAILLFGELEEFLGAKLEHTLMWDYPSIQKLATHLTKRAA